MTMDIAQFDAIVTSIADVDPEARENAAEAITDVCRDLDLDQATLLAQQLSTLFQQETIADCRESQLHTLCALKDWFEIPKSALQPLERFRDHDLGALNEYLRFLFDEE